MSKALDWLYDTTKCKDITDAFVQLIFLAKAMVQSIKWTSGEVKGLSGQSGRGFP